MRYDALRAGPLGDGASAEALDSHYSDGFAVDDLIFVSGQLPADAEMRLVGGDDSNAQAAQVFRNIASVLDQAGASLSDVVSVIVYVTDIADVQRIAPARREAFGAHKPSSTAVAVAALMLPGAKLEISAVARRGLSDLRGEDAE
jgi:enamine deaminase RidA (YjgF/YER057c/UK114 family)